MQIANKTKKIIETSSKWVDNNSKKVMVIILLKYLNRIHK